MMRTSIPVCKCDRCGAVEEIREPANLYNWGAIHAAQVNGPFRLGPIPATKVFPVEALDICPKCVGELKDWWRNEHG